MSGHGFSDIARERMYPTPYSNSSFLSVLLLSLASQKHTPDTRTDFHFEYDYIVVGAGSAGSVVASRLSENPSLTVLLLEAGKPPPQLTDIPVIARAFLGTDLDWNYTTVPQEHSGACLENRQVPFPSGKTVGGSSVINAMFSIRGIPEDYNDWVRLGARGWSWKNVFNYFMKLEDNEDKDLANKSYHHTGGPISVSRPPYNPELQHALDKAAEELGYPVVDPNGPTLIGFNDFQATIRRGQRCSTGKGYLVPSENRTNLHIVSEAFVTKIKIEGKTAVGVFFDYEGRRHYVRARKEIIVSCGALNTPRLLMQSGIGPRNILEKHKIPVIANLPVGRNFQDHVTVVVHFVYNDSTPVTEKLIDPKNIMKYIDERKGVLASTSGIVRLAFFPRNSSDALSATRPLYQLYFEQGGRMSTTRADFLPTAYDQQENDAIMYCLVTLSKPRSRGFVSIRSANPSDSPIIDPKYFQHPQDLKDIVSGMKKCVRVSETSAMQKLNVRPYYPVIPCCKDFAGGTDEYLKCYARSILGTICHPSGTAKMGNPHDPTTVVDPKLRVKGIRSLRVVDASIMPTLVSGNTNIPVIMIAEKASDMIKGSCQCSSFDMLNTKIRNLFFGG